MDDWGVLLFPGVILAFGVTGVVLGLMGIHRGVLSKDWPRYEGMIRPLKDAGEVGDTTITYEYSVNGIGFTSSTILYGVMSADQYRAIAARFPSGSSVTVYVNPDHPQDATLIPGVHRSNYIALTIGVMLLFISLWVAVLIWLAT